MITCEKNSRFKDIMLVLFNIMMLMPAIIYGGQNFSIDSYGIMLDKQTHISAFIGSLRWFGAFVYDVYYFLFRHNPIINSTIDCIIFVLLVAVSIFFLTKKLCKLLRENGILSTLIIDVSVVVSVINVWFLDILSFPECVFISSIGFILCFSAIYVFMIAKSLWQYILVSVLLVLSTGIYQQYICIFTIYVIAICGINMIKDHIKTFKEIFLIYIKPVVIIVTSGVIYLITGKIVQYIFSIEPNSRIALNISSIIENCIYYIKHQHSYLKGRGYFETELLTICFLFTGVICAILVIKEWIKNKNTLKTLVLGLSIICAYCSAYLPGILSTSHSHRAMFALFAIFALFALVSLALSDQRIIRSMLLVVLAVVFCANAIVSIQSELQLKKQNDADKVWCEQVIEEIEEYERTEQTINNIYYCYDSNVDIAVYTQSAVTQNYSLRAMINMFAERTFTVKEMAETEKELYFNNKEWTDINTQEQIVFVDDTAYLCCY